MLKSELKKLKLKSELISIERDCHDEEITGYIARIGDELLSMHLFDDNGDYDGFTLFPLEQITEVYWGNRAHNSIAKIITQPDKVPNPNVENMEFHSALLALDEQFESVIIHTYQEENQFDIISIKSIDEEWLNLETFAPKNILSPLRKLIKLDSISRITVDSPYQNKVVSLH